MCCSTSVLLPGQVGPVALPISRGLDLSSSICLGWDPISFITGQEALA